MQIVFWNLWFSLIALSSIYLILNEAICMDTQICRQKPRKDKTDLSANLDKKPKLAAKSEI